MDFEGGCYCGSVRYKASGDALFKGQCHCRECQYITGGAANLTMAIPEAGFTYTKGAPKKFTRTDIENAVTREFCGDCGTSLGTRAPGLPGAILLKVGSFDDPAIFEGPQVAIYTCDKQPFHVIADGVPCFEGLPG